jgi:hypothetical protein
MKQLINYLMVVTLFLDNLVLFTGPFDFYLYYLVYLLFLIYYAFLGSRITFNRNFFIILLLIIGISLIKTALNGYPSSPVIKQFLSISFSSIVYYLFIRYNDFNVTDIFKIYLQLAFWICVIGIVQQFLFIIGFHAVNPIYTYKLSSVMSEPSHLAIMLSPAFFVAFNRWLDGSLSPITKSRSIVIILAYLLTFSGVALLGIVIAGTLIGKKYLVMTKKYLLLVPLVILMIYFILISAYKIPDIQLRVDDTWKVITARTPQSNSSTVNMSTFALFSNYLVAKEAFLRNPFFGTGLGTHSVSYDRYINKLFPENNEVMEYQIHMALNHKDANSLLIRLISEAGLFGVGLFLTYLVKNMLNFKSNCEENYLYWLINNSILVFFILRLIRFGNYSALGFFLFFFMYYLTYKQAKKKSLSVVTI